VDVVDRRTERVVLANVAIVTGAFLPKTKRRMARPVSDGERFQQWITLFDQPLLDAIRNRSFDGEQQLGDAGCIGQGPGAPGWYSNLGSRLIRSVKTSTTV